MTRLITQRLDLEAYGPSCPPLAAALLVGINQLKWTLLGIDGLGNFIAYMAMRQEAKTSPELGDTGQGFTNTAGIRIINKFKMTNSIENALMPKALKTRLKRFLASQAFYSADKFIAYD
ncbi:hypothetical protein J6590_016122 [Homalodisca vitripennis]|nr:hypothetical protein J6590_016122 [Homalodisca vitripennis]